MRLADGAQEYCTKARVHPFDLDRDEIAKANGLNPHYIRNLLAEHGIRVVDVQVQAWLLMRQPPRWNFRYSRTYIPEGEP